MAELNREEIITEADEPTEVIEIESLNYLVNCAYAELYSAIGWMVEARQHAGRETRAGVASDEAIGLACSAMGYLETASLRSRA